MPRFHQDSVSRLDDIEALLTTAQGLAKRLSESEMKSTQRYLLYTLSELREARSALVKRWKADDAASL
jgi:hypothetical protein